MSDAAINFGATFLAEDINFDGYLDFSIVTAFGSKFGRRTYWIYDPDSDRFIQNELTREFGELGTNEYHLDSKNHELSVENIMAGCPRLISRFHIEDNHLVKVHEEAGTQFIKDGSVKSSLPPGVRCTVTYRDLVDGRMRITKVRHFVDGAPVR
jgi:hypothetical protein